MFININFKEAVETGPFFNSVLMNILSLIDKVIFEEGHIKDFITIIHHFMNI